MCGIMGIISKDSSVEHILKHAEAVQHHRGPDAQGVKCFRTQHWTVGLGHQRLAILDLTDAGRQPMCYENQNHWIVYNGEVYNYKEIRDELESLGCRFSSDSDTEVMLAALIHWGPDKAMNKFNGMWSFAWYDGERKQLILSRDRAGVKPLHYLFYKGNLFFASELKTILEMVQEKLDLNEKVLGRFLMQSLIETSNETFFQGVLKLPASHYATIDLSKEEPLELQIKDYWNFKLNITDEPEELLIEKVRELFFDSIKLRLRSDVPIGLLLSGGVDSSSIASAVFQLLGQSADIKMLSAVSDDPRFDESPFIDTMGRFLNKPVHKVNLQFSAAQAIDYLEQVSWFNDEPVGSFSNVAHFLLMKQAKELGVTVILSGQGADELLCGYKKYLGFYIQHLLRQHKYVQAVQTLTSFSMRGTVLNQFSWSEAKRYIPRTGKSSEIDIRGSRLQDYERLPVGLGLGSTVEERQWLDVTSLSIPILTHYEDRMSMAWAREVRVPFLDYRLIEACLNIPVAYKLKQGWTKYIFRKALEPYLPPEIIWRKDKQGFVNPQSEWFKNELKQQVMQIFEDDCLMYKHRLVDRQALLNKYQMYVKQPANKGSISYKDIFNPLALEIWLRRFQRYIS